MKILNKKGFTLIEILAIISILAVIAIVVVFVSMKLVSNAKDKGYDATINNIEVIANSYLTENRNKLFFVSDVSDTSLEYQCVTIKNLIDTGYFKSDVLESEVDEGIKVSESDYVYLSRNSTTKAVNKSLYIRNDESYSLKCGTAMKAQGNISFSSEPLGWSKEKSVTISYSLKNTLNKGNYYNEYVYDGISKVVDSNEEVFTVNKNSDIVAYIKHKDGSELVSATYSIDKIDNEGPKIVLGSLDTGYYKDSVSIPIVISDEGIGTIDSSSFDTSDITVAVGEEKITDIVLNKIDDNNYNIVINNNEYSGDVIIEIKSGSIKDGLGNENNYVKLVPGVIFDNEKPKIVFGTDGNSTYSKSVSSTITVTDDYSGGNTNRYKYIYAVNTDAAPKTRFVSGESYSLDSVTGDYYLIATACDKVGNCDVKISKVFKLDNTKPTCMLNVKDSGVDFASKDDNNSVTEYGMNMTGTEDFNSNTKLNLTTGTFYGYVKDQAGNTGSCSVVLSSTTAEESCSDASNTVEVDCSAENINNKTSACPSGSTYLSDNCSSTKLYHGSNIVCNRNVTGYGYTGTCLCTEPNNYVNRDPAFSCSKHGIPHGGMCRAWCTNLGFNGGTGCSTYSIYSYTWSAPSYFTGQSSCTSNPIDCNASTVGQVRTSCDGYTTSYSGKIECSGKSCVTSYSCDSGTTKLNDSYCYVIK